MLKTIQNWLMNVLAKWIWIAIMFPIRIVLGLCFAVSKFMPEKVNIPYKVVKKEPKTEQELNMCWLIILTIAIGYVIYKRNKFFEIVKKPNYIVKDDEGNEIDARETILPTDIKLFDKDKK